MNATWFTRFLDLAHYISMASKDPSTKVGAVIANDLKLVVGMGYNGFPRGVIDNAERYSVREEKYPRIVHAEINAVLNATGPVRGCTLIGTHFPCNECAKIIIQAGITRVVAPSPSADMLSRWGEGFRITRSMFKEARIEVWYPEAYIPPTLPYERPDFEYCQVIL